MYLRSGTIVSISSTSPSRQNNPTQGDKDTSSNVPTISSELHTTKQHVVRQNANAMNSLTSSRPMLLYGLPLGIHSNSHNCHGANPYLAPKSLIWRSSFGGRDVSF